MINIHEYIPRKLITILIKIFKDFLFMCNIRFWKLNKNRNSLRNFYYRKNILSICPLKLLFEIQINISYILSQISIFFF